jgi:hypothetical protein
MVSGVWPGVPSYTFFLQTDLTQLLLDCVIHASVTLCSFITDLVFCCLKYRYRLITKKRSIPVSQRSEEWLCLSFM